MDVGNLISGSSTFSKFSLYIWKFSVHTLLKPSLKDFERYLASMWNECNCTVVWTFFGIASLWDWNENWPLPVLWPLLSFPSLLWSIQSKALCSEWNWKRCFFLEFLCFSYNPMDVGNLISGFSAFSKSSFNIWKFSVHILLNPHLGNFVC